MGRKVLVDTNICIGYIGGDFPKQILDDLDTIIESEYHLSIINKIELLGFQHLTLHEEKQFRLLIENAVMHHIDEAIVEKTIEIRKNYRIKIPDAIIAATCLTFNLSLITLNISDFEKIEGLNILHPEKLQQLR